MKLLFEDKIKDIDRILLSKQSRWRLNHLLSFEDLSQIIRLHIYKKFDQWDQTRPFDPWCSRTVDNQIFNQTRNRYSRLLPPCLKGKGCPFNNGDGCDHTLSGKKDSSCEAYRKWELSKKPAYELKMAAPLEDYDNPTKYSECNLDKSIPKFHEYMLACLPPRLALAYRYLFMDHLSDEDAALKLGFTSNEKKRAPGYRQIINIKKEILKTAQEKMINFELEF